MTRHHYLKLLRCKALALVLCGIATSPVAAQIEEVDDRIVVELNATVTTESGCLMSFLLLNGYDVPVTSLVLEAVLFDAAGAVDRLTLFDFGEMPPARPRVRQFTVPELSCDAVSAVLINGATACTGDAGPIDSCADNLDLRTRTEIDLLG